MSNWDVKYMKAVNKLGLTIDLYKRYVDEMVMIVMKIIGEDEEIGEADERTMEIIREIGESIPSSIKLTKEFPSEKENL